jgi:hypothetical protein
VRTGAFGCCGERGIDDLDELRISSDTASVRRDAGT